GRPPPTGTAGGGLCALRGYETRVWRDAALSAAPEVVDWIGCTAGARVTAEPRQASFAVIADPASAPAFEQFALGTDEYPDRSTTLVLQVRSFARGQRLSLSAPGTPGRA